MINTAWRCLFLFLAPLVLLVTPATSWCSGPMPHDRFHCNGDIWTFDGSIVLGKTNDTDGYDLALSTLTVTWPIAITGTLYISTNDSLTISPPLSDSYWKSKSQGMITVGKCLAPNSFPPIVSLTLSSARYLQGRWSPYYTAGIDTECNTWDTANAWSASFEGNEQLTLFPWEVCEYITDKFQTSRSESNSSRYMMNVLFRHKPWTGRCGTPPPSTRSPIAPTKSPYTSPTRHPTPGKKKVNVGGIIGFMVMGVSATVLVVMFVICSCDTVVRPLYYWCKPRCTCCSHDDGAEVDVLAPLLAMANAPPPPPFKPTNAPAPAAPPAPPAPTAKSKKPQNTANTDTNAARQSIQMEDWTHVQAGSSAASFVSYEAGQW